MTRYLVLLISAVLLYSFSLDSLAAEVSSRQGPVAEEPSGKSLPLVTSDERKKLEEDARRLSEEFRNLFKDMSVVSYKVTRVLIDRVSEWINTNYPQFSAEDRKKVEGFVAMLQERYKHLESVSVEAIRNILKEFNKFIESIEKEPPPSEMQAV